MTTIPTREQIYNSIIEDIENEFSITVSPFGRSLFKTLAAVLAGVLKMGYLFTGNVQRQVLPDLADPEAIGGTLERHGELRLGRKPFPAKSASYTATVTGINASVIPASRTWKSDDTSAAPGYLYIIDNSFTLSGTSGTITIRALTPGAISRLVAGNTLTITSPLPGINPTITILAETIAPKAAETIEEYRQKVIQSYRLEPQGGSKGDYRLWGYDAQGVRQIYPYAVSGSNNEVNVYVEATIADSVDGFGTPTSDILDDVAAVIEYSPDTTLTLAERGRRPLGLFAANVLAIDVQAVNITIPSFVDLTAEKQATILAALTEALYNIRPFADGIDVVAERNDILDIARISSVILQAIPGSSFAAPTFTVAGVPLPTYTFDTGEIPYLDTITYS